MFPQKKLTLCRPFICCFVHDKDTYFNERTVILFLLSFGNRDTQSYIEVDMPIQNYKKSGKEYGEIFLSFCLIRDSETCLRCIVLWCSFELIVVYPLKYNRLSFSYHGQHVNIPSSYVTKTKWISIHCMIYYLWET